MTIKLLIVDDSAFMRKIVSDIVSEIEGLEVAGIARNGLDALEAIPKLRPDIITLDIEMPKLNGLDTLKAIKRDYDIPVIMLSSLSNSETTIEALQIGAIDFISKPKTLNSDLGDLKLELSEKIKSINTKKLTYDKITDKNRKRYNMRSSMKVDNIDRSIDIVLIGASTGGPKALVSLIGGLPREIRVPILIVQHMPKGFTTSFAQRLNKESQVDVLEAENNMLIERGKVYLAPGDYHMTIEGNRIKLNEEEKIHGVRPAVDYLFKSGAKEHGNRALGIILTGMGKDGAKGVEEIKRYGGYNIVQDEQSCVVYGMPGSAVATGKVDEVLSLVDISEKLNKLIGVN